MKMIGSAGIGRNLMVRGIAAIILVGVWCVNTVLLSGIALTSSTTSAQAHNGGRSRGRGRGRGWRGRGRGRGTWWPGACHIPGTSLWYSDCW